MPFHNAGWQLLQVSSRGIGGNVAIVCRREDRASSSHYPSLPVLKSGPEVHNSGFSALSVKSLSACHLHLNVFSRLVGAVSELLSTNILRVATIGAKAAVCVLIALCILFPCMFHYIAAFFTSKGTCKED